jgi:hypothetical protein
MTQQTDQVYRVDETAVAWGRAGDEIVILDLNASVYYGLDRDLAASDVAAFVDALRRHRLIQMS